jgi:phosphate transport system ATP-binding protein
MTNQEAKQNGMRVERLSAGFRDSTVIREVSLRIEPKKITAIIGPSGVGKSTLVRCLNRMHEEGREAWVKGHVWLGDEDIYAPGADPVRIRRRVGMVFQKPNPFPTMSVYDNVAAGLRLNHWGRQPNLDEVVEDSLRRAALWGQVKDKLHVSGAALSGGQQQRLCIARALGVRPDVLLMDEPCSALDPVATFQIEELMKELVKEVTIVIVTHNMQQAARVSDYTAMMMLSDDRGAGTVVEFAVTDRLFTRPQDKRTEDYITGRFG